VSNDFKEIEALKDVIAACRDSEEGFAKAAKELIVITCEIG
jgi:hypothetical protein